MTDRGGSRWTILLGRCFSPFKRLKECYVGLERKLEEQTTELREALDQQRATAEILRLINNSPRDTQRVLNTVASTAARLCDASDALIFRVDGDALRVVAHEGSIPAPTVDDRIPISRETVNGRSVVDRQTVHVHNLAAADDFPIGQGYARRLGYRTALATPLLPKERPIGTIHIRRLEARPFSHKQIKLLEIFADQAGIAIENTRLFNETNEALDQLKASAEILEVISSSVPDAKPVFDKILGSCERLFAGRDVAIALVGADGAMHLGAYHGPCRAELERHFPVPLSHESGAGAAILERRVVHYPDVEGEMEVPEYLRRASKFTRNRSVIFAPMLWEGRGVGAICVGRPTVGEFSEKEIGLLKTFADQAVIAIQNARLFHEIEEKSYQLELANQAKSRLLAAASHDLRQPINALALFIGQLQEKLREGAGPANLVVLAHRIGDSVDALQQLLDALLDISKLDAGAVVPERGVFALQPLFERMADEFAPSAAAKGLELRVHPTSLWLDSDSLLLGRIVMNLLSNAVRYTDRGRIVVGCRRRGGNAEILVADSGIGIAEEELTHIFKEFYQIAPPTHGRTRGLGLGLAIVDRLAHLLGHAVTVKSRLGRGSVFWIRVPMAAPQLEALQVSRTAEPASDLAGIRVLVVDDEAQEREAIGGLLEQWGCNVRAAADGDEALLTAEARSSARPDLILCDLQLRGGETGFTLLDRVRARWGDEVPCAIVTGDSAPDLLREAQTRGYLLLRKPTKPAKLRALVEHMVRERIQRQHDDRPQPTSSHASSSTASTPRKDIAS